MTYKDIYDNGRQTLERAGIAEAKLDARLLLEYVCGTKQSDLIVHPDRVLDPEEEEEYRGLIDRRSGREPVAYILGSWEFMGLDFKVTEEVLIPEQDSEFLVEEALRVMQDGFRVLDLCTGSGCIALSILNYTNDTSAVCTDISEEALKIARYNASSFGLSERSEFVKTDLFPKEEGSRFDVIVSNPPYIASGVIDSLEPEVRDYEPRLALDGDVDGLSFYRRIIKDAGKFIFSSGYIILEIGYDQADAVCALMNEEGHYHEIEVIKDFSGNDRVVRACYYWQR